MQRKLLGAISCVALAAGLATGCSSSNSGGGSGAHGGPVTLKVIGWKGGPAEPANIKQINDAFEAAHPNIKIDYSFQPAGDTYTQKLNAEFLAGQAPDVVMAMSSNVANWSKSGYLADLSAQPWVAALAPQVKPLASEQGKVYGEPSEVSGIGLYSNMSVLKKAGIDTPPADWPTFLTDLAKLKAAGQPGLALPDKSGWTVFTAVNATASSQVFASRPNWNDDLTAGKATFAGTPGWKTALQRIADLGTQNLINYKDQLGVDEWSQGTQDFKAGKSAFLLQGTWARSDLAKGVNDLQFSPWPGNDAGAPAAGLEAAGTEWTINARSAKQDAAKEYLQYWATSEALTPYLTAEAAQSPFTNVSTPKAPGTEAFDAASAAGRFWVLPENGGWATGDPMTAMQSAVTALILGQKNVDQTLAAYDKAVHS